MGRPRQTRELTVWMNGELVGTWVLPARSSQAFHYAESWLSSPNRRPLSLSLQPVPGAPVLRGPETWLPRLASPTHSHHSHLAQDPGEP